MNTNQLYERITDTIIEMLETHKKSNFSESWYNISGDSVLAKNVASNHVYRGINQLLLNFTKRKFGYEFNRWLTFKQISKLGGKVKKGSKSTIVVYKSQLYLDSNTGENITSKIIALINSGKDIEHIDYQKRGYMKYFNVFNLSQVDNLPDEFYKIVELEKLTEFEHDEQAEHLISCTQANISFSPQNEAFYKVDEDKIYMPLAKQFVNKEAFYNVIFHEIGHMVGHPTRLNRPIANEFGSKEYAFQELICEITSAYVCAVLGYESRITDNVEYIDNWLSVMKNYKKFVIQAASQAQKASDYILEFAKVQELETT